jgi:Tfp pilus assembly protein PilO
MKTNFNKRLAWSVGIIVASIVLIVGAIVYAANDLNADANKFVSDRAAMQANTAALARLADLERDAPQAILYGTAIDALLPTQANLINIPPEVAALAAADGVTATFTFKGNPSAPPAGSVGTVPFSISVQGTLANMASFLQDLESKNSKFLLSVDSFSVNNSGNTADLTGQGTLFFQ